MKITLDKTYDIAEDFSVLGKTRRELMGIDLDSKKLLQLLQENSMEICDWKILIDIVVKKLDVKSYRLLYDGDTTIILVQQRLYLFDRKTKAYVIMDLGEFDTGVYPDGAELAINESVIVTFTDMYIEFKCSGCAIRFLISDYLNIVARLYN